MISNFMCLKVENFWKILGLLKVLGKMNDIKNLIVFFNIIQNNLENMMDKYDCV